MHSKGDSVRVVGRLATVFAGRVGTVAEFTGNNQIAVRFPGRRDLTYWKMDELAKVEASGRGSWDGVPHQLNVGWAATEIAVELMERQRNSNERGDLYLDGQYTVARLLDLAELNRKEAIRAINAGEDVGDKIGDLLNYWAFIAHLLRLAASGDRCDHVAQFADDGMSLRCGRCGIRMRAVPAQ
jgi:NTP pyrophosphatase (non-canonical NTP hydrolase)